MNYQEIHKIFKTTANRIFKRQYRYFVLDRQRISEDEACHVMTKVLEELKYCYGIEQRTKELYRTHVGLVDLVIIDKKKKGVILGWVEFKRGAASEPKMRKDFVKMMKEKVEEQGKELGPEFTSFFHIIPVPKAGVDKEDRNTAEAILNLYEEAHRKAYEEAIQAEKAPVPKEFVFFLLDCEKGRYFIKHFKNILEKLYFGSPKWSLVGYGPTK